MPADLDIHVILDNASSHKTKLIRGWFAKTAPLVPCRSPFQPDSARKSPPRSTAQAVRVVGILPAAGDGARMQRDKSSQNIIDDFLAVDRISTDKYPAFQNNVKGSCRITFGKHQFAGTKLFSVTVLCEIKPLAFRKVSEKRMVCEKGSDVVGHDHSLRADASRLSTPHGLEDCTTEAYHSEGRNRRGTGEEGRKSDCGGGIPRRSTIVPAQLLARATTISAALGRGRPPSCNPPTPRRCRSRLASARR